MNPNSLPTLRTIAADLTGELAWVLLGVVVGALAVGVAFRRRYKRLVAAEVDLASRHHALQGEYDDTARALVQAQSSVQHYHERLTESQQRIADYERVLDEQRDKIQHLENRYTSLQVQHTERERHFELVQRTLEQSRAQLKAEFQALANDVLEAQGRSLSTHSQQSLDALLRPFREQLDQFQKRVDTVHGEAVRGNASLATEIKRVSDMSGQLGQQADQLALALRGEKKTVGTSGEVLLERSLQAVGLVAGEHYQAQPMYRDSHGQRRHPDFVIFLPDDKQLIIDSKVSLIDYERAVASDAPDDRVQALDAHVLALRRHIDDLSGKEYHRLSGLQGPGFVLMYLPIEAAYIEALRHSQDLYEYAWRRHVVLVSHTTLVPVLKMVTHVWSMARSHEQAHALSTQAGELYDQILRVVERLKRLGQTLGTASRHYNDTVRAIAGQQGLTGKATRFADLATSSQRTPSSLDALAVDFQHERLGDSAQ